MQILLKKNIMINGLITGYILYNNDVFVNIINQEQKRNLILITEEGLKINITVSDSIYSQYCEQIDMNSLVPTYKFTCWGELKNPFIRGRKTNLKGLTNLVLKTDFVEPYEEIDFNSFSFNAHLNKTEPIRNEISTYYMVGANKYILNKKENKTIRSTTYSKIKTPSETNYLPGEILQGTAQLIEENGELLLKSLHCVNDTDYREVKALIKYE